MLLELAENKPQPKMQSSLPAYATLSEAIEDNYINIPDPTTGEIVKVREDVFDNMPDNEWNVLMDLIEPYNTGMNGWLSNWRERRAEKKEERKQTRTERVDKRRDFFTKIGSKIGEMVGGRKADVSFDATGGQLRNLDIEVGQKQWYQNPAVIIGGLGVLGLGAYLLLRKK